MRSVHILRSVGRAGLLAGLTLAGAGPAAAAVRVCRAVHSSEVISAATQIEAHARAIAGWQAEARKYGKGYDSWRLAMDKVVKCLPQGGKFACVAAAAPCIISQRPGRPAEPGQAL